MPCRPGTLTLALVLAAAPVAQESAPAEDPEIRAKVERLGKASRARKFARDEEAIQLIEELAGRHAAGLHKKDSKRILGAFSNILTKGRLRKPPSVVIYSVAAIGLEGFGDDGAKVLMKAHEKKRFPRRDEGWLMTRVQLLRSLGATKSEDAVEFLIDVSLKANDDAERGTAGGALGHFDESDQKVRKQIAKSLIRALASLESEASRPVSANPDSPQDFGPRNAKKRLDRVFGPWTDTLKKLTGESFDSGEQWRVWFEKARRKRWD